MKIKIQKRKFIRNIIIGIIALLVVAFIINIAPGYKRNKYKEVINLIIGDTNVTEKLQKPIYKDEEGNIYISKEDIKAFLSQYVNVYSENDTKEEWFGRIKSLCAPLGFAADTKEYKANKEAYKGSAGDLSTILRIAVTGRRNTPDLWNIMQVLGPCECKNRILDALGEI